MKCKFLVEKIEILPLVSPLIYPFRTALGQHDNLENVLFRLTLSNGVVGQGEAAVAPHITGETVPQTAENLKAIGERLIGQDIRAYRKISQWLWEQLPKNKSALAAVEMAILDALTQARGIPLWKMFGPKSVKLTTDITIVIDSLEATQKAVTEFYRQGFRSFKVKIGRDWDLDFKRVLAVKEIAKRSAIYLDANQGYTAEQAILFLRELRRSGIQPEVLEQPVPKTDLEGLAQITREKLTTVIADESVSTRADCRRIIRLKAANGINIKLMKSGLIEGAALARFAKSKGLKLMIGGMMESPLAMTAAAHFASGLNLFDYIDLDPPFFIKGGLAATLVLNSRGVYDLKIVKAGIGSIKAEAK